MTADALEGAIGDDHVLRDGLNLAQQPLQRVVEEDRIAARGAVGGADHRLRGARRPGRRAARRVVQLHGVRDIADRRVGQLAEELDAVAADCARRHDDLAELTLEHLALGQRRAREPSRTRVEAISVTS